VELRGTAAWVSSNASCASNAANAVAIALLISFAALAKQPDAKRSPFLIGGVVRRSERDKDIPHVAQAPRCLLLRISTAMMV